MSEVMFMSICAIHMVNAWRTEAGLSMGQFKVDSKSNEITAIPELLRLLELSGSLVTIDAMGCQKTIAACMLERKADYLLVVKANQKTLHTEIKNLFDHYWTSTTECTGCLMLLLMKTDAGRETVMRRKIWRQQGRYP